MVIDEIIKLVEDFNDSIIETLNVKKINDTREAARSLHVKHGKDFVQSIGIFYIEFLETGRFPGKMPPLAPIEDWVERKLGIDYLDSDFDGVVYAIRKKIADMGTRIYQNNSRGLEIGKKIVNLRKAINEEVQNAVKIEIQKKLDRFIKKHKQNNYTI